MLEEFLKNLFPSSSYAPRRATVLHLSDGKWIGTRAEGLRLAGPNKLPPQLCRYATPRCVSVCNLIDLRRYLVALL